MTGTRRQLCYNSISASPTSILWVVDLVKVPYGIGSLTRSTPNCSQKQCRYGTRNMYAELMKFIECSDPAIENATIPIYAVTIRTRSDGKRRMMDNWFHPLAIGQVFPTLPIWLKESLAISLELESSYEETCRMLRIR